MSVLSTSLGSSLSTVGISVANPSQLAAIRDTVNSKDATAGTSSTTADSGKPSPAEKAKLTPAEERVIAKLQRTDAAVRAHEQAHIAAGRELITSGPNYDYTYGPDGKQYAVGGEVGIDTSAARDPQANIDKGKRIQAAALAPADPSPQDYRVASVGESLEEQGRVELSEQQRAQAESQNDARVQAYASPPDQVAQVDTYA